MGETAIVAGVGPWIGEAVVREFHDAGMDVGMFARSSEFVADLADDLGDGALAVPTDVTDEAAVRDGVAAVRDAFGEISALVVNASAGGGRPVEDADADRLRSMFDVRVAGLLACVQAALPDLREANGTVVVSGTTYADPPVTEQLEWGAVAPAARGLAVSLDESLPDVQVSYVRIGSAVRPQEEAGPASVRADAVAAEYRRLVEQGETATRELDLRRGPE
ncbi:MAG: SDR family oxidoreductase [Halobacterium sp.]